jgi:hypothetical protein
MSMALSPTIDTSQPLPQHPISCPNTTALIIDYLNMRKFKFLRHTIEGFLDRLLIICTLIWVIVFVRKT